MGSNLEVDVAGVRTASSSSDEIAATLAMGGASPQVEMSRPSGVGIAAVDSVSGAVRTRQSKRIAGQATDLSSASIRYGDTDDVNAEVLDETM